MQVLVALSVSVRVLMSRISHFHSTICSCVDKKSLGQANTTFNDFNIQTKNINSTTSIRPVSNKHRENGLLFYFTDPPCCQTFNYRVPSQFLIKQCQTTSFNLFNGFQKPTDKLFIPAFLLTKLHGSNSGEIKSMHFYLQSDLPSPKKA